MCLRSFYKGVKKQTVFQNLTVFDKIRHIYNAP